MGTRRFEMQKMSCNKIVVCLVFVVVSVACGFMLYDKIHLPVWVIALICILVIISVYIKSAIVFVREKRFVRLVFLTIFAFLLCLLLLMQSCHL